MEKVEGVYHEKYLGLLLLSIEILIEHFQVVSFIKDSLNPEGQSWNSSASNLFDGLSSTFFIPVDEDNFKLCFITSSILIGLSLILYLILSKQIHEINKGPLTYWLILIQILDHILFGLGFNMMLACLLGPYGCNIETELIIDTSVNCWTSEHLSFMMFGFVFASLGLVLVAGFCTLLRAERNGVERPFGNDLVFPSIYKILNFFIVSLLSTIGEPYLGIGFVAVVMIYLMIFEAYEEIHMACMKMACLTGLLWAFICAEVVRNDGETGSDMMTIGWGISLIVGYGLIVVKNFIFSRNPVVASIEK
ncbi:hypothetical protein SteCoe_19435 [Stentor coeruleus]|uniref:Uncharacterized protein n=1 Tax=Stentor coeruleus TaxID=5963 RepID=A0A1R2BUK7_9CILI|nr:hypothetical protein SteCoe_19435 [Stentor coeruleus]